MELEGLTGEIRFNEDGRRQNYSLQVMEMSTSSAMVKVADWTDQSGLAPVVAKFTRPRNQEIERNKTYIVTTIVEEPYIMMRKPDHGETLVGNERFEGYCKDLADLLAKRLGITCKIKFIQFLNVLCVFFDINSIIYKKSVMTAIFMKNCSYTDTKIIYK